VVAIQKMKEPIERIGRRNRIFVEGVPVVLQPLRREFDAMKAAASARLDRARSQAQARYKEFLDKTIEGKPALAAVAVTVLGQSTSRRDAAGRIGRRNGSQRARIG